MIVPMIPNNNLKTQLEELAYIINKLNAEVGEESRLSLKFRFSSPATDSEIESCEKALGMKLPVGYKEFLKFSNGAQLCGHTAEFETISYVIKQDGWKKSSDFPKDYIIIADLIGDGECLCLSRLSGKFIRYFDGKETEYNDFYSFFEWLLNHIKERAEDYVEL